MKKMLCILVLLLNLFTFSQVPKINASLINATPIEADEYIGEDNIGFLYFIKKNILFKIKNGEKYEYKNIQLGEISKVDLQNPLRILVFFSNFNTIIALDNQLNEVQKLNFNSINNSIALSAIGIAGLNNYWIFNETNQQLLLYNYIKNTTQAIGVIFEKPIKNYSSTYNNFFWIDTENNFYQCSIFGKKTWITKLPEYDQISITDEKIIVYQRNEKLFLFDIKKQKTIPIENIENSFISFYYKKQNLAIFTAQGITNHKIILP
ncbi:hypothetical protein B0A78_07610 [Flavobacterium columnare NBRC 100251 = ATCC 23463]|uniref:hypothetical protein n=2 Tax=Flavobacterium columnare TaxID=996 RepID=UPI000BE8ED60|nr:hypothetical protein B0A78_07610 [Flavobacterium columnare NBRC 100251 = ATCC 23463]GEM57628.1 hypothetical protein FC1_08660 [Flavobacterium columnare NBRC 100251 = ATCC 23463]